MTYAFNTREVAEALVHVGNREMARKAVNPSLLGTEIITVKTPVAGIDARDGIDCSSAECNLAYVNKSDELVDDPNVTKVVVYNTTGEDIAGDQYIAATRQRGVWVASTGGGGGTSISMFVSSSSIPADGEGTANDRTYDGTSWTTGTESFTIVNPWSDAVSTGKKLTAYKHSSGKWIMIQAECEDA